MSVYMKRDLQCVHASGTRSRGKVALTRETAPADLYVEGGLGSGGEQNLEDDSLAGFADAEHGDGARRAGNAFRV